MAWIGSVMLLELMAWGGVIVTRTHPLAPLLVTLYVTVLLVAVIASVMLQAPIWRAWVLGSLVWGVLCWRWVLDAWGM